MYDAYTISPSQPFCLRSHNIYEEVLPINLEELQELAVTLECSVYPIGVICDRPCSNEVWVSYYDDYILGVK